MSIKELAKEFHCDALERLDDSILDPELISELPVEYARARLLMPVRYQGEVAILTENPATLLQDNHIALLLGVEPVPLLADAETILQAIEKCYFARSNSTDSLLENMSLGELEARTGHDDLLRSSDQTPVTQFVNTLLLEALKAGASDIHIEPFGKSLNIRFRLDGLLYEHTSPPKSLEASLASRLKIMAKMDIAEKRLPQDGMMKLAIGEREVDVRVSTIPAVEGERIVLRLLRHDSQLRSLTELGMGDDMLERFRALLKIPHGVIWVTGPTGSGKTTTLYAALTELDTRRRNILTIEDPVEYQLPDIGQMSIKPKIGLTFSQGLRHILRQDPDVILVGETRDQETADIVVQASLTGHLVFSTLHTNDALSAVVRLTDMGAESYLVAESTRASLAQRLLRKLCPACKKPDVINPEMFPGIRKKLALLDGKILYRPEGCSKCRDGYQGRTGIYELIIIDAALEEGIRKRAPLSKMRKLLKKSGERTLFDDGLAKVEDGTTSLNELLTVAGQLP